MSRRQVMMFMCARWRSSNSSQRTASSARCWRLMRTMKVLSAMIPQRAPLAAPPRKPFRPPLALSAAAHFAAVCAGFCGLQPIRIIAIRKFRLVIGAASFIALECAYSDHARENQHVAQLADKIQSLIGPLRPILQVNLVEPSAHSANLFKRIFE